MRSLKEIEKQIKDLDDNYEGVCRNLCKENAVLVHKAISSIQSSLKNEYNTTKEAVDKYDKNCVSPEFMNAMFSNKGILDYLSKELNVNVTSSIIANVLRDINKDKRASNKSHYTPQRKSNQITSSEMSQLTGGVVFDFNKALGSVPKSRIKTKSSRKRTHSENYSIMYSSQEDSYDIIRADAKQSEGINVFTLGDYYNNLQFLHKEGHYESIVTLGVNLFSLKGIPCKDGKIFDDRSKTDRFYCSDYLNGRSGYKGTQMYPLDYSKAYQGSIFVLNTVFIKEFLSALCSMGYAEDLFNYFIGIIQCAKNIDNDDFLNHIIISNTTPKTNYWTLLSVKNKGVLYYSSDIELSRHEVYRLMKLALECVCQVNPSLEVSNLMECVKFYGGFDPEAQDIIKFKSSTSKVSNLEVLSGNFYSYLSCKDSLNINHRPTSLRFNYNNNIYTVFAKDLDRTRKSVKFSSADVLLSIIDILLSNGVSIDNITKPDSCLLSKNWIYDTPNRTNAHVKLPNNKYYYIVRNVGWRDLAKSLPDLFNELGISLSSLSFCFD